MTSVKEMRRHLELYVKKDLFSGIAMPSRSNRRYFPKKTVIRNKMYKTYVKNRFSKIDQENLAEIVKIWQQENKNDDFYFRRYSEIQGTAINEHDEDLDSDKSNENEDDIKLTEGYTRQTMLFVHQTSFQRSVLKRYGNYACFLDATYKTTKYALPLFFLAVKTNVDYQVVGRL